MWGLTNLLALEVPTHCVCVSPFPLESLFLQASFFFVLQFTPSTERDIAGDAEEEEEEEKLDYDAADSMIVSTSVEDGEGDDILAELGTAGQPAHAKAKSSQVAEPEPRPEDIVPVPANTATPSQVLGVDKLIMLGVT